MKNKPLEEAAPDLLAVAEKLVAGLRAGEMPGETFFCQLLDEADAAISKARR